MSDNLGLPQMTAQTANKEQFLDDLFALIDSSITSNIAIDASVSNNVLQSTIQNYIKVTATNVPKNGTTLTLPPMSKMLIIKNDRGSLGSVTFACGASGVTLPPGTSTVVHTDGTANGIEATSAGATLAGLGDVDYSTLPTNGQALVYDDTEHKWKPGSVAAASGGTTGGDSGGTTGGGSSGGTAPAPGSGHILWRCRVIGSTSDSYLSCWEAQFRTTAGKNQPMSWGPGAGYASHGRTGGFSTANIYDGDTGTRYAVDTLASLPIVWGWSFTVPVNVVEYAYLRGNAETPSHFVIEWSDDAQNWTIALEVNNITDASYHQDGNTLDVWNIATGARS